MPFLTVLWAAAAVGLLLFIVWPVRPLPFWVRMLPAGSLFLLVVGMLLGGFQGVLLGLLLLSLALLAISLIGMRRPARHGRARMVFGALLGLLALGFAIVPPVLLPVDYLNVKPGGELAVGTVTYGWEDSARPETFTEDPADHRRIAVQFWYPADGQPGSLVEGAPISGQQPAYPLVVFSHGAFGARISNTSTYLELASRGYIVASIDHTYHAFFTSFPDGQGVPISPQFLGEVQANQTGQLDDEENQALSLAWLDLRDADIRFTLDQVELLNVGSTSGPLAGHIDLERIGLFGHSLGGAASASVCRVDPRCQAAAVIDATMLGEFQRGAPARTVTSDPYPRPLMIFYNGDTYHAPEGPLAYAPSIAAFEHAAAPAYSLVVNGAQHLNFTDLPGRAPILARLLGSGMAVNGGTAGTIDQARCTEILNAYLVAFFDQTLRGETSPLLAGGSAYPEVEFSARAAQ